jgi:hypothetical protein
MCHPGAERRISRWSGNCLNGASEPKLRVKRIGSISLELVGSSYRTLNLVQGKHLRDRWGKDLVVIPVPSPISVYRDKMR